MSLLEYDIINNKVDKSKTWIDISQKLIYSREIKVCYRYYTFCSKFELETKEYNYYVICSKYKVQNTGNTLFFDDYGRAKIKVNSIFNELKLNRYTKDFNLSIIEVEETDDYSIYKIVC